MMNRILFNIYRVLVPKPLRTVIVRKRLRNKILRYYSIIPDDHGSSEKKEVVEWLRNNRLEVFPYDFCKVVNQETITVEYDNATGLKFVDHEGKRLYFKRRWSRKRIIRAYRELKKEQYKGSPHRYLSDDFNIAGTDIIADIGAAEGNFSLSVVDKVRKLYIFEYNREWIEALNHTFAPWKEKVVIIKKRVSDRDSQSDISMDSFLEGNEPVSFIKIDVEGAEKTVLAGSRKLLGGSGQLKIAVCTYHHKNDEADLKDLLGSYGFSTTTSPGYMIHYNDKKMKAPYLRRGLLRAVR